jgi:hypothetical protein
VTAAAAAAPFCTRGSDGCGRGSGGGTPGRTSALCDGWGMHACTVRWLDLPSGVAVCPVLHASLTARRRAWPLQSLKADGARELLCYQSHAHWCHLLLVPLLLI